MPSGCETCPKCGEKTLQPERKANRAYCLRVVDCGYSERREPDLRAEVARLEGEKAAMAAALRATKGEIDADPNKCLLCYEPIDKHCEGCPAPLIEAALSDAGTKKCEKCRGTGARHVAGEPTQEPCGECSGEGVVSDAGKGWVPPEVSLLLESLAGRWAFERFGYPDDTYPAAALELLADLDALGGT